MPVRAIIHPSHRRGISRCWLDSATSDQHFCDTLAPIVHKHSTFAPIHSKWKHFFFSSPCSVLSQAGAAAIFAPVSLPVGYGGDGRQHHRYTRLHDAQQDGQCRHQKMSRVHTLHFLCTSSHIMIMLLVTGTKLLHCFISQIDNISPPKNPTKTIKAQ